VFSPFGQITRKETLEGLREASDAEGPEGDCWDGFDNWPVPYEVGVDWDLTAEGDYILDVWVEENGKRRSVYSDLGDDYLYEIVKQMDAPRDYLRDFHYNDIMEL